MIILQFLRRGTTVLNFDADTNQVIPVFLKLESCHGTVTWCRPPWGDLRPKGGHAQASDNCQFYSLSKSKLWIQCCSVHLN